MLQVRIHGPDDVRLDEVPEPQPGPRDAVVRVASCGICGSDLGYIRMGGVAGPVREPMPLGHELSGIIEAVGDEVAGFAPGDRMALDPSHPGGGAVIGNGGEEGGFAPLLLVRDVAGGARGRARLHRLPDAMPFDIAALAEPLGVGMNAVDKVAASPGEKAVVFGAGPIGLGAVASLRGAGVEDVISVDLSPHRLGLALELGARATVNPAEVALWPSLRELHGEVDFMGGRVAATEVFVEASGASHLIQELTANARRGARLSVVALHRTPVEVNFLLVLMRELQINGAMEYPAEFGRSLEVLERDDLSAMITHRFPLERFHDALAVARDASRAGKVMIEIGG
jgi:threonine dehydrogenase-like Zn-dependent dehydrogenase